MNDTEAIQQALAGPDESAPVPALRQGTREGSSKRLIRVFGAAVVVAAILTASFSFLLLTGATDFEPSPELWTAIWIVNGLLVLTVIALVVTEGVLLVQSRVLREEGAGLQIRMVAMFALVAAVPAALVAVVASIALNQGLDQWFSERTRSTIEASRLVARSYLQEHSQVLRDDIIWVAEELESRRTLFDTNNALYQRILRELAVTRSLPFTSLISGDRDELMRVQINVGQQPPLPDAIDLNQVGEGRVELIAPGTRWNQVGGIIKLRGYDDTYLFATRPVNAEVLEYVRLTEDNLSEYRQYASNRVVFQVTFTIMYIGTAVVLLLAALWIGIALANRFVDPIRHLMVASSRVSRGDLDVQVPVKGSQGDLRDLSSRFNLMTRTLKTQHDELVAANATNEKRREFTEAVVEGVSAGIVGLDAYGTITLVNGRACEMLGQEEMALMGKPVVEVVPELTPIVDRAQAARRGPTRDQIQVGPEQNRRTYQVQITREGSLAESKGFVLTLDDITDLEQAQRTSAWADVARRIAHEIKNPLTPIQLSAERLRRRYADKLADDFDVFDKCINTIVRQVGDIGRMVDEFSAFARMPSAVLESADLNDTIRQAVFLEAVRLPEIAVRADLPERPIVASFDARLIAQVLTNLIKNAVEAMESVGLDKIKHPAIVVTAREAGAMVQIDICDNGKGWPKENRQRLLEPYVTTRDKGTGLGLAIVARIIEQHGGHVELIDAEPDAHGRVGACFSFTLPKAHPGGESRALDGEDADNSGPQTAGDTGARGKPGPDRPATAKRESPVTVDAEK